MAFLSQLPAFRSQDAIPDFAEFHFKFPVAGIVYGIFLAKRRPGIGVVQPRPHLSGKLVGTAQAGGNEEMETNLEFQPSN